MRSILHRAALALLPATLILAQPAEAQQGDPFPGLIESLQQVEGMLGVVGARTDDGKNVLFVWFENKDAVLRWYHSPYHRAMADRFFPDRPPRIPMEHVAADAGPILVVASVTFDQSVSPPFRQIAVEMYTPLAGGLALGGTFTPERVTIPHMVRAPDLGPRTGYRN